MSFTSLPQPRSVKPGSRVVIVAARFNNDHVEGLIQSCLDELEALDPSTIIEVQRVPGSYELPLAVQAAIQSAEPRPDAVIAFGILFEGETAHALLVAQSVTQSLLQIALEQHTPVINQVLLLGSTDQADARAFGNEINRGTEAARAALAMIEDLRRIRRQTTIQPAR